jgi:DUF1009 family protein
MREGDPVPRLGLIAGCGGLPREAAASLRRPGRPVVALAFEGLTDAALAGGVDAIRWHRLGQLDAAAAALRAMGVERVLLVGSVPKRALLAGSGLVALDATATSFLARTGGLGDDALFALLARWLEGEGFAIARQDEALASLLAAEGGFSARPPSDEERHDLEVGREALRRIGGAGIGQCVVVKRGCVVAVEAVEGTDAAIRRAGGLAGPGATVVKGARPGQDRRFDLPAVGPETIEAMIDAGAGCLAVEAGATLVLERASTRARADAAGIALAGFPAKGLAPDRGAS